MEDSLLQEYNGVQYHRWEYAKGELTREQYLQMKEDTKSDNQDRKAF